MRTAKRSRTRLLPLLLLLLGTGGCNLNGNSGNTPSPPPVECPNGQPVEEDYQGIMCHVAPLNLIRTPEGYTPESGYTFRLGETFNGVYHSQFAPDGLAVHKGDESVFGTLLRYYRLPGFSQYRFFAGRSYPPHFLTLCRYNEDIYPNPPPETMGKCSFVQYYDPNRWTDPTYWLLQSIVYVPRYGYTFSLGGAFLNSLFYPVLQGKDGDTEAQVDLIVQLEFPTQGGPPLAHWVNPPVVVPRSVDWGPYFALDELLESFKLFKGPAWGRSFEGTFRYRFEPLPGGQVRVFFRDHDAQGRPIARFRRNRDHDPHPLSQGYFSADYIVWVLDGGLPKRGAVEEAIRWENTYRPASDDYYVFEVAQGHVTPPAPLCLPGGVIQTLFLVGPYQPRGEPVEPYLIPGPHGASFGHLNYIHHLVVTRGREAGVVSYQVDMNRRTYPVSNVTVQDSHPKPHPVIPRDTPDPFQDGVERWAVFYRSTPRYGWEPSPAHTPYEDRWKVVWSDVRMTGTPDLPKCGAEAIGFYVFSEAESRALDSYLGLQNAETRYLVADPGTGYPYGIGDNPPVYDPVGPMLTRLYRPSTDPNARLPRFENFLTAAAPGEVTVPILPPGW